MPAIIMSADQARVISKSIVTSDIENSILTILMNEVLATASQGKTKLNYIITADILLSTLLTEEQRQSITTVTRLFSLIPAIQKKAIKTVQTQLEEAGYKAKLQVTDNQLELTVSWQEEP